MEYVPVIDSEVPWLVDVMFILDSSVLSIDDNGTSRIRLICKGSSDEEENVCHCFLFPSLTRPFQPSAISVSEK
jgi:hypothetical protein